MRETLRLSPTAPFRGIAPLEDVTLKNGTYAVEKDVSMLLNITMTQRDSKIWGADVSLPFWLFETSSTDFSYRLTSSALRGCWTESLKHFRYVEHDATIA